MRVISSGEQEITLYYGRQILNGKPYYHDGIDIVRKNNRLDTIIAAEKGKVINVVNNVSGRDLSKGYGNYVDLQHGENIITRYCHLKHGSIKVKIGEIINRGKEIGYMGDTGYTFGAHLHFQIIQKGTAVDPLPYLNNKKKIIEFNEKEYVKGDYVVMADVLNVRRGPGKNYEIVRYPNLTENAKQQMKRIIDYPANGYVKGMKFTALELNSTTSEIWAKTPSGWVCIYNKDGIYCKKI